MNWLELKAIHLSLVEFLPLLQGQAVLLMTDNTTAVSCLRRQGTLRSEPLMSLTRDILELALAHSVTLVPRHLPGRLNVLADQGSRTDPVSTEWSLDGGTFDWLCTKAGPFQVDLFATRFNCRLPVFVSPFPDPQASGVNALSIHWDLWDNIYMFPPTPILPEVVARLQDYRGGGVLVAPSHAQSSWYPLLLARARDHFPLPPTICLSQTTALGPVSHPNPFLFALHAWIL